MIPQSLLLYCLLLGGVYLAVMSVIVELVGRLLKVKRGIPESIQEEQTWGGWLTLYLIEFLFFVAVPSLAFAVLYTAVPLTGMRSGLAAALFAVGLGAAPVAVGLSIRLKLYMPFLMYQLLGHLLKLGGTLTIISYLYFL